MLVAIVVGQQVSKGGASLGRVETNALLVGTPYNLAGISRAPSLILLVEAAFLLG